MIMVLIRRLVQARRWLKSTSAITVLPRNLSEAKPPQIKRFPCVEANSSNPSLIENTEESIDLTEEQRKMYQTFPCITQNPSSGPEPAYNKTVSGYEVYHHEGTFPLYYNGCHLDGFQLAYETWGELNEDKSNVILLQCGLSASSHARSHEKNPAPGWWEQFIRPGGPLDLNHFFVICSNNLGGCYGSTGPSSIDPHTGRPFATSLPIIAVNDMVRAQFLLLDHLGIDKVYATVGSSLGGMQSLLSAALYPERVGRFISISACAMTHPSSISLRYLQRKCIMLDPNWRSGCYYDSAYPKTGMKLAREIGTMTYRSGPEWDQRFSRKRLDENAPVTLCPTFVIENYLDYQGETFSVKYDPNSLLYISKAMDLFDMSEGFNSMEESLARIRAPALVIGAKTDILFPIQQQQELVKWLEASGNKGVTFFELNSIFGHDTFLLDLNGVGTAVKGFLEAFVSD